ncbi:MAG: RtcB family protein [Candidatus Melainabacteria bacterium]|nr:RtcB family protein [Candidatus Melainabacteria bacterium]
MFKDILQEIGSNRYLIPKSFDPRMKVDVLVYSSTQMLDQITKDLSLKQAINVATLPGIVGKALVMPDCHQGYGFPIGGVAAMDLKKGVVSPGGVGFDINCGVRLLTTPLTLNDVVETTGRLSLLVNELFNAIPAGTGSKGNIKITTNDMDEILLSGAKWTLKKGFATKEDLKNTEAYGCLNGADPSRVSNKAKKRGFDQLGTLGSGNHFLEVQYVEKIHNEEIASLLGISKDQIVILIHCGSRGLGHQVCTDYVHIMQEAMKKYGIEILDRELACTFIESPEGKNYLAAMNAAANFAWANRQCIAHAVRKVLKKLFGDIKIEQLYDVAHNIAKEEMHKINGIEQKVLVHRKGATRAFAPGNEELDEKFQKTGQPVLIPGDMGRYSYLLTGQEGAMDESFGSVCHGAGRMLSRTQAKKISSAEEIKENLKSKGIIVKSTTKTGLTEEISDAYKDVKDVVGVVEGAGLAKIVAKLHPIGVVKG